MDQQMLSFRSPPRMTECSGATDSFFFSSLPQEQWLWAVSLVWKSPHLFYLRSFWSWGEVKRPCAYQNAGDYIRDSGMEMLHECSHTSYRIGHGKWMGITVVHYYNGFAPNVWSIDVMGWNGKWATLCTGWNVNSLWNLVQTLHWWQGHFEADIKFSKQAGDFLMHLIQLVFFFFLIERVVTCLYL